MNDTTLVLPNGYQLSSVTPADQAALVAHLNNPAVTRFTGSLPYPYTASDAERLIGERQSWTLTQVQEIYFAIRQANGELIGAIGIVGPIQLGQTRVAEAGYWLAQPWWGQGIMTRAVTAYVQYAFEELGLHRLFARVFDLNTGSWRVLEKNGFRLEGVLRQHVWRHEQYLDDRIYGLLKAEWDFKRLGQL